MLLSALKEALENAIEITLLVFLMMVIVDFFNVRTRGMLLNLIQKKTWRPYFLASLLGVIPGCFGSFMAVTMYVHGLLGFGALVGNMVAATGDAAFLMISVYPEVAVILFAILFVAGIIFGPITQFIANRLHFVPCKECQLQEYHAEEKNVKHYFTEHIWHHIIKEHLLRVFLWIIGTLFIINLAMHFWDLKGFVQAHPLWVFFLAALTGLIPDSGPNFVFALLFGQGAIPFSVLLTNSISQDGHGILPLLSYTVRDTVYVKLYCLVISLIIGGIALLLGF